MFHLFVCFRTKSILFCFLFILSELRKYYFFPSGFLWIYTSYTLSFLLGKKSCTFSTLYSAFLNWNMLLCAVRAPSFGGSANLMHSFWRSISDGPLKPTQNLLNYNRTDSYLLSVNKALFCLRDFTCILWYSGVEEKQAIVTFIPNYLSLEWKLWSDWLKERDVNTVLLKETPCAEKLWLQVPWAPPLFPIFQMLWDLIWGQKPASFEWWPFSFHEAMVYCGKFGSSCVSWLFRLWQ